MGMTQRPQQCGIGQGLAGSGNDPGLDPAVAAGEGGGDAAEGLVPRLGRLVQRAAQGCRVEHELQLVAADAPGDDEGPGGRYALLPDAARQSGGDVGDPLGGAGLGGAQDPMPRRLLLQMIGDHLRHPGVEGGGGQAPADRVGIRVTTEWSILGPSNGHATQ